MVLNKRNKLCGLMWCAHTHIYQVSKKEKGNMFLIRPTTCAHTLAKLPIGSTVENIAFVAVAYTFYFHACIDTVKIAQTLCLITW